MNYVKRLLRFIKFLFFLAVLWSNNCVAQDTVFTVSGTVKDAQNMPLQHASVTLVTADTIIIGFALSDAKGQFTVAIPTIFKSQNLWLEASFIGYHKKRVTLQQSAIYTLMLDRDPNVLSEVIVRNKPALLQMGDTLRYIVSSFAKSEDRSIGDVLRRMPGITVDEDGAISHNGKKIANLYIHGDDLMSGKYGTATKVVKKEMIQSVDVIQNHQPIKVLKDKVFSDKTSINLVLKNENEIKVTGAGILGLGLPKLYQIGGNAILLNKVFKAINTVAVNNAGIDYSSDTKSLGSANMIQNINSGAAKVNLSLASIGDPSVPKEYYYVNQSGLINLNNLYNLKSGLQLKLNAQGFMDKNNITYHNNIENYIDADTIRYFEKQEITHKPSAVNLSFNMMSNKTKHFFNNNTSYTYEQNRSSSFMHFNQTGFNQNLKNNYYSFSNDVNFMPSVRTKGVIELRWLVATSNYTNRLQLLDSFNSAIAQHQGFYDRIEQKVNGPETQSNAYISYRLVQSKGTFETQTGWLYQKQTMHSRLSFTDDGITNPYQGDSGNDLNFTKNNIYLHSKYDIRRKYLSGSIGVPFMLQQIHYEQQAYLLNKTKQHFIVEPKLSLRYQLAQEQSLSFNYNFSNAFGNYTQLYRGVILTNYRSLQSNDADVKQSKSHATSLFYNYGKSIKLFFFNAGVNYRSASSNTMVSTVIEDNAEKTILVPMYNKQSFITASTGASKFLHFAKINSTIDFSVSKSTMNQLLNHQLIDINLRSFAGSLKLNKRFSQWVAMDYNVNTVFSSLYFKQPVASQTTKQSGFNINNAASFSIVGIKRTLIDFSVKHAYNKQSGAAAIDYFFADSKIRYTPNNKRMDFTILFQNLLNVKTYRVNSVDAYRNSFSEYALRGRTFLCKLDYFF
ncbi:MAG: hypothetical protein E6Q89_07120 [Bacteroidia bacterium]|nr:MAG: hypothetical protein E6Q89_07120 [Bacteroidia bacterium]